MNGQLYLGVDVGTGSARAGIFDSKGSLVGIGIYPIQIFRPEGHPLFYQQSSEDIWQAVGKAVAQALKDAAVSGSDSESIRQRIVALAFDATCSLVALGPEDEPLSIDPSGSSSSNDYIPNIILWLDHRARKQAEEINRTRHPVLKYVGGTISPENEIPKLKWIKESLPQVWKEARKFMDLADFLSYRSTGRDVRSLNTLTAKWCYTYEQENHEQNGWNRDFFETIGLGDVIQGNMIVKPPGSAVGSITDKAAQELGLKTGTIVACGIVDAYAGSIGILGIPRPPDSGFLNDKNIEDKIEHKLAVISGTSTCHLTYSPKAIFVEGIWGPFFLNENLGFCIEAGQSTTGAALEFIIRTHPSFPKLQLIAQERNQDVYSALQSIIADLATNQGLPDHKIAMLTRDFHVVPHFQGRRSPQSSQMRAAIIGLSLDSSVESLALYYLATVLSLAYETKYITSLIENAGHASIKDIYMTGGQTMNRLLLQCHADITNCRIILSKEKDAVLLGTAMLAATAHGDFPSLNDVMSQMSHLGEVIYPCQDFELLTFHKIKYEIFQKMNSQQYEFLKMIDQDILTH